MFKGAYSPHIFRIILVFLSSPTLSMLLCIHLIGHWQPFGPDNRWKWSSSQSNYELPHWGLFQFYGGGGYNVDVFGSAETFKTQVHSFLYLFF
jgi:hypothetical protein